LPKVKIASASYLSVYDIMNADVMVITEKSLDIIKEWLGGAK
jgi:ribosomal protein L4